MKITFIGTSHGVPAKDRYCSCTMIEVGGSVYFLDAGAPLIDQLLRHDKEVSQVRAVFTTHSHGDHTNGLIPYASLVNWYYKTASASIYLTEQALIDAIKAYIAVADAPLDEERVKLRLVDGNFTYSDENLRLSLIPTRHLEHAGRPSYAILLEAEGKKAVFSGDLSGNLAKNDVPAIIFQQEVDLFVCEMAHFGPEELAPYLASCKAKEVWINHIWPLDKIRRLHAAKAAYPFPIHIAEDGDVILL